MPKKLLVVANSGRLLAHAAHQIGLKPIVIDVFADSDTQTVAYDSCQIPSLSREYLVPAVTDIVTRHTLTHFIYSSGFEYYPESLGYLMGVLDVLGNDYFTFQAVQERRLFFSMLDSLAIPYPDVSFTEPELAEAWLIKPLRGNGGRGIKRYMPGENIGDACYWQKFQEGTSHSVLFLANAQQVHVVGFNTQWNLQNDKNTEFVFSGIINNCDLVDCQKQKVIRWIEQLVPVFGLVGLNSLDFIYGEGNCYLLEINPRPPASMQLYEADLLRKHINACQGIIASDSVVKTGNTAYQVLYAEDDLTVPRQMVWPSGVVDIPSAAALIRKGQPICSIIAHEKNSQLVFAQLETIQQQLIKNLKGSNQHGIHS